jgi:hypothetical protein
MGVLEIEFGIYTSLGATSINSGQTRLSAAVASAADYLRIGNIEVVGGWVGVYIWASNSSTPYVLFDMYSTVVPSFTSIAWAANPLPAKRSTEIIGDISATTFIGALTGTATNATNADTVDNYHASTSTLGNYIVVRDGNGYINGNYINMSDDGNPGSGTSISSFITKQGDNYYRSVSPTNAMISIKSVASGDWGINITGNSATATTSGLLTGEDNRTISPSESTANRLKFGFTSWANNNTGPYADFIHLRSYQDSSGGNDNLVMFRKDAIGMRIWQQTWGSATAYSSFKDVAFTGVGTANYLSKYTDGYSLANSQIYDNGTGVGIGNTNPNGYKLNVTGAGYFSTNVTSPGFFNTSDARLKDIIERDGDTIKFTWKDGRDTKIHIGYVAQEVQETYPDQVNKGDDGMLTINYIEVLVAKIQELENRIKQLEK